MSKTGMHHFCHRQPGVYGAKKGESTATNGVILSVVDDKPHGAILAFDDVAFSKVGYFDEQFGKYGAEHVDWSNRVSNSGLQASGYFDVENSDSYFLVHQEQSSVEDRIAKFKRAKAILDTLGVRSSYVEASNNTIVPRISCVIPFRDINRKLSIITVLGNIRSQLYPDIEIIMTEEDDFPKATNAEFLPAKYVFTSGQHGAAFNKSKAFNIGVELCTSDWLVLHDADTLAPNNYFKLVGETLSEVESCHLCNQVLYLNAETTRTVNSTGTIGQPLCSHIVDYFEGGTIACHRKAYWKIGGFAEEVVGYGCEDNDFYYRLSKTCTWRENRCFDLLHLQHDRIVGWAEYHRKNKELERRLFELSINDRITRQRQMLVQNGRGHCL
jgi:GT2 family glycosyltransferase